MEGNRHTHAWGAVGVGLGLLFGTVPLARYVSPHGEPWWQPGLLLFGAVLVLFGLMMFALPSFAPTGESTAAAAGPGTEQQSLSLGPRITLLERPGRRLTCYEEDENGPAMLMFTIEYRVGNPHLVEPAVIYRARLRSFTVNFDKYADAVEGGVNSPLGGPPIRIAPRQSETIRCLFMLQGNWERLPTMVSGEVALVDQFGTEHSATGTVTWVRQQDNR